MADAEPTITTDEWLVAHLAIAARNLPTDTSDADVAIETIETLRTLREHVADVAGARGFDLETPVGVEVAARVLNEAAPALTRTLIKAVPQ